MEIWKNILGYEGLYMISNFGNVKSMIYKSNRWNKEYKKEKLLNIYGDGKNYKFCVLFKNGKRKKYYIHRLIAESFISNPKNKAQVNHKDGNKQNNEIRNLEWVTPSENVKHAFINRLNIPKTKSIVAYKNEVAIGFKSLKQAVIFIKNEYPKANYNNISRCLNKRRKTAYGFNWKYISEFKGSIVKIQKVIE